ncbi:hypothetical protein Cni_G06517 [Canna indica]|uniref:Uncharacterized protein n=1 Tax=Canna indica TaxID=4628 RepID=A0AAQ3Q6M0_9LILI|nr:hypothetical protein Cni_G06517 [Canna indica]
MATERPEKPCHGVPSTSAAVEERRPADLAALRDSSARQIAPPDKLAIEEDDDDASSEDFEFAFAVRDPSALPLVTADEIFFGGRILPTYPVFNRDLPPGPSSADEPATAVEDVADKIPIQRLLIDEGEARAEPSSEHQPVRCKKSGSTGSSLRWRLRDMVIGRSHSDGKEKFVFLEAAPPDLPPSLAKKKIPNHNPKSTKASGGSGKSTKKQADMVTAHRLYYVKGTSEKAVKGPRRSFLPYRQELLGLFAPVNGLRRTYNPF